MNRLATKEAWIGSVDVRSEEASETYGYYGNHSAGIYYPVAGASKSYCRPMDMVMGQVSDVCSMRLGQAYGVYGTDRQLRAGRFTGVLGARPGDEVSVLPDTAQ